MKPKKIVLFSLIALFILTIITFFHIREKPYKYFDPQNTNNTYTITADDNYFYVNYDSNKSDNQKEFTGIISSAAVDLHQFLNKKVKLNGKFINTTFDKVLCPKESCQHHNRPLQALEIISISLAE